MPVNADRHAALLCVPATEIKHAKGVAIPNGEEIPDSMDAADSPDHAPN